MVLAGDPLGDIPTHSAPPALFQGAIGQPLPGCTTPTRGLTQWLYFIVNRIINKRVINLSLLFPRVPANLVDQHVGFTFHQRTMSTIYEMRDQYLLFLQEAMCLSIVPVWFPNTMQAFGTLHHISTTRELSLSHD